MPQVQAKGRLNPHVKFRKDEVKAADVRVPIQKDEAKDSDVTVPVQKDEARSIVRTKSPSDDVRTNEDLEMNNVQAVPRTDSPREIIQEKEALVQVDESQHEPA